MESLIAEGGIDGVLDLTTTEWADEVCGGVCAAGPERLAAAAMRGVPQVVAPGCLDMVNFFGPDTVPPQFCHRRMFRWNPNVTLMRTNLEENELIGRIIADKLNDSHGPVTVLLPLRGFSQLGEEHQHFWCPDADRAFIGSLLRHLRSDIPVIEIDAAINDRQFSERAARELLAMMRVRVPSSAKDSPSASDL
jgi:uncharacterized protein (UPF0261 family)